MKKALAFFIFLLFLNVPASAEEAQEITLSSAFKVAGKGWTMERLFDRDWNTYWQGETSGKKLEITPREKAYGLYLCWMEEPKSWVLEEKVDGAWMTTEFEAAPFMHQYVPLRGAAALRLKPKGKNTKWFGLSEVFIFGKGEVPSSVQQWQSPDNACDLMVYFAHPDDEALFMGGTIPYYAGERGLDVVAAVFTGSTRTRRSELLNSLWTMGMRNYPVFGPFHDSYSLKLAAAYEQFGENKVKRFAVELMRRYRPKVVVTHDVLGEYGHGMHQLCADSALYAFDRAGDATLFPDSAEKWGAWQVQKLYLHLYPENRRDGLGHPAGFLRRPHRI